MTASRFFIAALLLGALAAPARAAPDEPAACPAVAVPALHAPHLAAAVAERREIRIVAFGSSSTAGAGASVPWRTYPYQLERALRRALPDRIVTVMNRGKGGEEVTDMIRRFETDVIAEAPDLVIWQLGANAALRNLDLATFRRLLTEGLTRLRAAGIDVVLMDNQRTPRILARPTNHSYDAVLAELAATTPGVTLFSRGGLMDDFAAAGVPFAALTASDGLHHNDRGYACVADALGRALVAGLPMPTGPSLAESAPGRR